MDTEFSCQMNGERKTQNLVLQFRFIVKLTAYNSNAMRWISIENKNK